MEENRKMPPKKEQIHFQEKIADETKFIAGSPNHDKAYSKWYSQNVVGVVTEIGKIGIWLNAPELPFFSKAFMHISQADEQYVVDLNSLFTLGQSLTVKVRFFRRETSQWEVSRRAVLRNDRWEKEFPKYTIAVGHVDRIGDFGALIRLKEGFVGRIAPNVLGYLRESELPTAGAEIEVKVGKKWDLSGQGPLLIPCMQFEEKGLVKSLKIRSTNKKRKLLAIIEVDTERFGVVECDITKFINRATRFAVGSRACVSIRLTDLIERGAYGTIVACGEERIVSGEAPEIGSEIEAEVLGVVDYGAFCLVADGVVGMLHHSFIVKDRKPELGKYVRPGDLLKVRVKNNFSEQKGSNIDFVSMVSRFQNNSYTTGASTLFDLDQTKRKRVAGGFKRDLTFREKVLTTYQHVCALCGKNQLISEELSIAEAAHIVPHSARGASSMSNAICLCPICHWAFDKGLVAINDSNAVVVSSLVSNTSDAGLSLLGLRDRKVLFPISIAAPLDALEWHFRNIFWNYDSSGNK